jgi:cytochrome c oxidase cbb3-type subunit 3
MPERDQSNAPRDILREHSYDGIQEYDNQLPRWWLALFGLSVVWAVFYIAYYHLGLFGGGLVGPERLQAQLDVIQKQLEAMDTGPLSEEQLIAEHADLQRISSGEQLFLSTACNSCHESSALGNVGPNLRDDYWLYGNRFTDLVDTITQGRNGNQMPAHGSRLTRRQIQDLAFYLVDLNRKTEKTAEGATVAAGKKPEGQRAAFAFLNQGDAQPTP